MAGVRMKKKTLAILIPIIIIFVIAVLVLCSLGIYYFVSWVRFMMGGYNSLMRNELGNPDNYASVDASYQSAYYWASEGKVEIDSENFDDAEDLIYIDCLFKSSYDGSENIYFIQVIDSNTEILAQNGFFDEVSEGMTLSVRADFFMYMDNEFYFVASIECNGKTYLDFDQGMKNIVEYMNARKI